ncbi:hypothetical protein L7F22_066389 [Adiantum nelumboides]|nr:hypothetical protein [Adiantum nelumboides]
MQTLRRFKHSGKIMTAFNEALIILHCKVEHDRMIVQRAGNGMRGACEGRAWAATHTHLQPQPWHSVRTQGGGTRGGGTRSCCRGKMWWVEGEAGAEEGLARLCSRSYSWMQGHGSDKCGCRLFQWTATHYVEDSEDDLPYVVTFTDTDDLTTLV